jgi:hypothetical protein
MKQFATWEFFVPSPEDLESRLGGYDNAAHNVLGEGVSAGTVYDLAPWSWMVDWFVDVGGLLHYQQALADNQIAALANGVSLFNRTTMNVTLAPDVTSLPTGWTARGPGFIGDDCSYEYFRHQRVKGNPYDILGSWTDFSSARAAVLGAIGITRAL